MHESIGHDFNSTSQTEYTRFKNMTLQCKSITLIVSIIPLLSSCRDQFPDDDARGRERASARTVAVQIFQQSLSDEEYPTTSRKIRESYIDELTKSACRLGFVVKFYRDQNNKHQVGVGIYKQDLLVYSAKLDRATSVASTSRWGERLDGYEEISFTLSRPRKIRPVVKL